MSKNIVKLLLFIMVFSSCTKKEERKVIKEPTPLNEYNAVISLHSEKNKRELKDYTIQLQERSREGEKTLRKITFKDSIITVKLEKADGYALQFLDESNAVVEEALVLLSPGDSIGIRVTIGDSLALAWTYDFVNSPDNEIRKEVDARLSAEAVNVDSLYIYLESKAPSLGAVYGVLRTMGSLEWYRLQDLLGIAAKFKPHLANYPYARQFVNQIESDGYLVGEEAPEFTLQTIDQKELTLSDYRGNYVLVDFWASWCRPCIQEMPHVKEVYNEYHKKGLHIIGVSTDQKEEEWKQAVTQLGLPWTHVNDRTGEISDLYQITSIPAPFLLNPEGKIIAKGIELRGANLKKRLGSIFSE